MLLGSKISADKLSFTPLLIMAIPVTIIYTATAFDGLLSFGEYSPLGRDSFHLQSNLAVFSITYLHSLAHNIFLPLLTPAYRKKIVFLLKCVSVCSDCKVYRSNKVRFRIARSLLVFAFFYGLLSFGKFRGLHCFFVHFSFVILFSSSSISLPHSKQLFRRAKQQRNTKISSEECLTVFSVWYFHSFVRNIFLLLLTPAYRKKIVFLVKCIGVRLD